MRAPPCTCSSTGAPGSTTTWEAHGQGTDSTGRVGLLFLILYFFAWPNISAGLQKREEMLSAVKDAGSHAAVLRRLLALYVVQDATEALYREMREAGFDVVMDDRDERPGVKFADMELLGIPHQFVIGERSLGLPREPK